jgi:hypothetical protein
MESIIGSPMIICITIAPRSSGGKLQAPSVGISTYYLKRVMLGTVSLFASPSHITYVHHQCFEKKGKATRKLQEAANGYIAALLGVVLKRKWLLLAVRMWVSS